MKIMALKLEIQNDSMTQEDSFSLPKITNVESVPCSDLKQKRRRRPPVVPVELRRRSARLKEKKQKLENQNGNPQHTSDEIAAQTKRSKPRRPKTTKRNKRSGINAAATRKSTNTQCATVIWRNVEPSPNLPLVSTPRNEPQAEREPDRVLGLVSKDERIFVLVKWRHTDAPEYVEKQKCSPEILLLLNEFLNPIPSEDNSEPREEARIKNEREETIYKEFDERQQTDSLIQIQESSRTDNCSLHIKLE